MRINLMHQRSDGCNDCPATPCKEGFCWVDSLTPGTWLAPPSWATDVFWWSKMKILAVDEGELVGKFYYWDNREREERMEYNSISLDTILTAIVDEEIKIEREGS